MIKRKNGFITFILSFMPGCAEMYWGYMKEGLSLLGTFALISAFCSILGVGPLGFFMFVAYVYCFFHARNMVHMTDEELREKKDEYIFDKETIEKFLSKNRISKLAGPVKTVIAACLILFGIELLIHAIVPSLPIGAEMVSAIMNFADLIPRLAIAVLIILAGIWLIVGKKEEIYKEVEKPEEIRGFGHNGGSLAP